MKKILFILAFLLPALSASSEETQDMTPPQEMSVVPEAIFSNNPQAEGADKKPKTDPSLTTRETAIECATAIIVESAGQKRQPLNNPAAAAFKAGLCSGKIQTYMIATASANPACFPKIELEEGIRMFVRWADAHPDQGATQYPAGLERAFEEQVPCLKK